MVETRNANFEYKTIWKTIAAADVDTDGSGDATISIPELRIVKSVQASAQGGYKAELQSISGKTVKIRIFDYPATNTVATAKTSTTDVCVVNILAVGY